MTAASPTAPRAGGMIGDPLADHNHAAPTSLGVTSDDMIDAMRAKPPMSTHHKGVLPHGDPFAGYDRAKDPVLQPATQKQLAPSSSTGRTLVLGIDDRGSFAAERIMEVAQRDGEARRSAPVQNPKKLARAHGDLAKLRERSPRAFATALALANVDQALSIDAMDEPTVAKIATALASMPNAEQVFR